MTYCSLNLLAFAFILILPSPGYTNVCLGVKVFLLIYNYFIFQKVMIKTG